MENRVNVLTFRQLKEIISDLENNNEVTNETKIFIDTGWDSVQEVAPNAICVEKVMEFSIEDEWTKETFPGFSLIEKAEHVGANGKPETAVIIRNLY